MLQRFWLKSKDALPGVDKASTQKALLEEVVKNGEVPGWRAAGGACA